MGYIDSQLYIMHFCLKFNKLILMKYKLEIFKNITSSLAIFFFQMYFQTPHVYSM